MLRAFGGKGMNLAVLIPIWKRHDLTKLCFKHLKRQQEKFGFQVLIVGSEGEDSRSLTELFGFEYLEYSNDYLGEKLNAGMKLLTHFDGVVVLGSDDILPDKAWSNYLTLDMSKKMIYGYSGVYFYSVKNKTLNLFTYRNNIQTIGAGRLYTGELVRSLGGNIWSNEKNKGLDADASQRCKVKETILKQVLMIDIKHSHNITSHAITRSGIKQNPILIRQEYGNDFYTELLQLKPSNEVEQIKTKSEQMKVKRVKVKITGTHPSLVTGSIKSVDPFTAKQLVKKGMAEYHIEGEEPEIPTAKIEVITPKKSEENGKGSKADSTKGGRGKKDKK